MNQLSNKTIMKGMLFISLPVILQMLLNTSLGFIDQLMVGQLGEAAISGVGTANQITTFLIIIFSIVGTGVGILAAQYIGKKDVLNLKKLFGTSMSIGILFSILLTLFFFLYSAKVLFFFHAPIAIEIQGALFLKISSYGIIAYVLTGIISAFFRSATTNKPTLYAAFVALISNIVFDYIFIFIFHWGVVGAAWATNIACFIEIAMLLFFFEKHLHIISLSLKDIGHFSGKQLFKVLDLGWPISVDLILWQLSLMINMTIVLSIGLQAAAINQVLKLITGFIFTPALGLGAGISAMIGQNLGKRDYEASIRVSKVGISLSLLFIVCSTAVIVTLAPFIPHWFNFSPETKKLTFYFILFTAIFQIFQLGNLIFPNILRSGGDTKIIIVISSIGIWCVGIPTTLLLVYGLKLGLFGAILGYNCGEIVKSILFTIRYLKKRWMKTLV